MLVKAAPGLRVPKEAKPREYITDAKAVDVPETPYYLRALAYGDLMLAQAETASAAVPTAGKSGKKE
ncbi:hypothetical protein SAMN04488503_1998 [Humidesulfovibrio mexicanus]|uniref:DUF2635 domain-containing protein n=1 Tax=Humidesulfovibrio mexicanus TaxID=147047 RepID=A0A239AJS1_9BACT|nr:hypothetical protein [Humidesulfovibrio mexicanus]SNR95294.1 hypothetical protein SAMN04488503_1998 [Humidesulfovibrio mexicanus]